MAAEIDVNAYFSRIGYNGDRAPTLGTLAGIQRAHAEAIPFENLNPFLGLPVPLDIESLQEKIVRSGRGGYCFEHNILLTHVLRELGFSVKWLGARVLWNVPEGTVMPRTHMVLLVDVDNTPYVVDVGFGGLTLTTPLQFVADLEQTTTHEPFRLIHEDGWYTQQAQIRDDWTSLYRFDLTEMLMPDYEIANWFVSSHPKSRFVNGIIAARVETDRRHSLMNNSYAVHQIGVGTERRTLSSAEELRKTLEDSFRITLPETDNLVPSLQRLVEANNP